MNDADAVLIVVFGLPGAGKTFVARRLAQRSLRGRDVFVMHDGDDDLPDDMRDAINQSAPVTTSMRERFVDAIIEHTARLRDEARAQHQHLVVAQTFLKSWQRDRFRARFPDARFVLVVAGDDQRQQRLAHRSHQPLDAGYARAMTGLFDAVDEGSVDVIVNDGDVAALDAALDELIAEAAENALRPGLSRG